jgi:hypothetical protein
LKPEAKISPTKISSKIQKPAKLPNSLKPIKGLNAIYHTKNFLKFLNPILPEEKAKKKQKV